MSKKINTIIFDLGGVLIDWNPRYLYRKLFKTEEEITWFLENICTMEWNDVQDEGRSFEDATKWLLEKYPQPELEEPIKAWYGRWQETISGPLHDTVEILKYFKDNNYRLYALTNWSEQTYPWTLETFEFMHWFEGVVVSGIEKSRKPYPEFYNILFNRYDIDPSTAIFIDDNHKNVVGANAVGLKTIHFKTPAQLKAELQELELHP